MRQHAFIPNDSEILPGGVDPLTLFRKAEARRREMFRMAERARRAEAARAMIEPVPPPPPEPDSGPSWVELALRDQPAAILTRHPLRAIIQAVAQVSGISQVEIYSDRRTDPVVKARQTCFFLARQRTTYSLPAIGHFMGGKDHTTILYACEKVGGIVANNGVTLHDDMTMHEAARAILAADWSKRNPDKRLQDARKRADRQRAAKAKARAKE